MRYRIYVEVEYLIALSFEKKIEEFPALTKEQIEDLRKIYRSFDMESAKHIKEIESETNHDVKAVEYYIQQKTEKSFHPWIHFALTFRRCEQLVLLINVAARIKTSIYTTTKIGTQRT